MNYINIIAMVNVTKNIGKFNFVFPIFLDSPPKVAINAEYSLRLKNNNDEIIGEYSALFYLDSCVEGNDKTGIVETYIPYHENATSIELIHDNQILSKFIAGEKPNCPESFDINLDDSGNLAIKWINSTPSTHLFQARINESKPWTSFGIVTPENPSVVFLDRYFLALLQEAGVERIEIKVTTTNGFDSVSKVFAVLDKQGWKK